MGRRFRQSWSTIDTVLLAALSMLCLWNHRLALGDILTIGLGREEQSHILLAPFVAGWLLWIRRTRLRSLHVKRSLWGPVILAAGWGLDALGMATDTQVLWHLAPIVSLIGLVVSVAGFDVIRKFLPVFGALLFMIPVPGVLRHMIAIPLQTLATTITGMSLGVLGIEAIRVGDSLMINDVRVAVGEACNGMRMVFALTLVVYAFAFSTPLRPGVRMVLLILSPVAALLSNVIRLIPTTLFFGYGSVGQATLFHDLSGWAMLPVALVMLIGVLRAIQWIELPIMSFRLTMR